jgi:protoheme IX farnesyltransferase
LPAAILKLIKYKLSLAVTLSATMGFFLFRKGPDPALPVLIAGVFMLAGGSAALNEYQERKLDAMMGRTRNRPIPSGNISPRLALILSIAFILTGLLLLSRFGITPVLLGAINLLLYNGLYTPMKIRNSFAVLPGGLVGAIPPVIGWTAAGGPLFHPNILYIAALMFMWQLPHFWLLIVRYGKEYEAAGFSTLKRYLDDHQIKRLIFFWMAVSSVFLLTAPLFGILIDLWVFLLLAVLNMLFIGFFYYVLFLNPSDKKIRLIFILTNVFLTVVLGMLILNSLA